MKRISARISSIRRNGNQTSQYQEVDGIGLFISLFRMMFWRPEIEHRHAGELFCHVFARIPAVFLLILSSNALIEVDTHSM